VNLKGGNVVRIDPVVTVAMSVLNGGDQLQMAVRSIVEQTFEDWELLIIDDGSTDGAIEKLPFLNDQRVVVIRDGLNKGLSARLNQAINMARGKYFARMDHDDISHPNRLDLQITFLRAHPHIDLLATKCVTMDEADQITGFLPYASSHQQICARPWLGFPMPHPSWMGKLNWFRKYYYQDPAPYCCEDNGLLLRAFKHSTYHAIEADLLAYRLRSHSPWQKIWKTRKAMAVMQIQYFWDSGEWLFAFLSCVATFLRVMRDITNETLYRFMRCPDRTRLDVDLKCRLWPELIAKYKK